MEELEEPTLLQTLRAHRSEVTCADVSGAWLASGGGDRTLRLWRWRGGAGWGEEAAAPHAHRYGVTAARWAPGSGAALLASAGVDGAARVWGRRLAPRRLLAAPGAAAARALCWPGRRRLLVGHDDGALCVWHVPRALLLARLHAHDAALHAVAAPAQALLLLTACTHGVLKVFDLAEVCQSGTDGTCAPTPLTWVDGAHDLGALCADASEDGRLAATGGHDGLVRVWCAGRGARGGVAALGRAGEGHAGAVTALRWAGALLASAALDRTARLWRPHPAGPRCLRVLLAHPRYLTCVALERDLRYMVTGSNDKSLRMWSLGSLTLSDELDVPCAALEHFALGDLQGIGPVDDDHLNSELPAVEGDGGEGDETEGGGARRVWHSVVHAGAINYIATHDDLVATASSDGVVRVFRWSALAGALQEQHVLAAHGYPATAADFGAGGAVLLTGGLDGRACLWDVQSGVQLRSVCVPGRGGAECGAGAAGEGAGAGGAVSGGGGVRAARLGSRRPPLLLLGTDDALAPCWSLATSDPDPIHVFAGQSEAVTCCAWSCDSLLAAAGTADGQLRLHSAPPLARELHHEPRAHDLGVQSCDFAQSSALELPDDTYMLATAGSDSLIKLWRIQYREVEGAKPAVSVCVAAAVSAHGGGASCVRWHGLLLASAGADRWVRVWRVRGVSADVSHVPADVRHVPPDVSHVPADVRHVPAGETPPRLLAAVRAPAAAAALLGRPPLLLCGSLLGELSAWQLPPEPDDDDDALHDEEGTAPSFWSQEGVERWLRENIARAPGSLMSREEEADLIQKSRHANITGSRLITDLVESLLEDLGYGELEHGEISEEASKSSARRGEVRALLRLELGWLRRAPPTRELERSAPHALLCPLSHALLREPARAADGYTYERANILDWFLAADGAVSPVSGQYLRNAHVLPNYALRDQLREYLLQHDA